MLEQISGFVSFFIWLLVFKSFFLPLFIIPTGSMAETLCGEHASHTCPNCGREYNVGFDPATSTDPGVPPLLQCPNCRLMEKNVGRGAPSVSSGSIESTTLSRKAGDRIVVHGWLFDCPFDFGGALGPRRWDVVVFKNPNEPDVNYIKRLIGLPGETIEIIDGDVFINDAVARKTPQAQSALWFSYYDHDCRPRRPTGSGFFPHWAALAEDAAWRSLDTREPHFDGADRPRGAIRFVTQPTGTEPGLVQDVYGYNSPTRSSGHTVTSVSDVRLSCDVEIAAGQGYVELSTTKYDDEFFARLYADGKVTLEQAKSGGAPRTLWGTAQVAAGKPHHFALANADYVVIIEIDGRATIRSAPEQYGTTPEAARARVADPRTPARAMPPRLEIAAEKVDARVARLLIERDVYYCSDMRRQGGAPGRGTQGQPFQIGPREYFVMGDNSPNSHDSRLWTEVAPFLRDAVEKGQHHIGTVPADQMIGRAFFVYWPGFLPLGGTGLNLLPDVGRARWIH